MSIPVFARVHRSWIDPIPATDYTVSGPNGSTGWGVRVLKGAVVEGLVPPAEKLRCRIETTDAPVEKVCEGGYQVREGGKLMLVIEW